MKNLFNMQRFLQVNLIGAVALSAVLLASSCNKDFPNTLRTQYPNDTLNAKGDERKVLYIILDGVRGQAVDSLKPAFITQLARNSVYSYDGLVDSKTNTLTNASAWSNMLTGVTSLKHHVTSNDFAGNDLTSFPSVFTRLKSINPAYRTVSLASSASFNAGLATNASDAQTFATDEEVKNATVSELKNKNAKLVVAQFHSADVAGANNAYLASNAVYAQAITTLDSYVDAIVTELKNRKNYTNENWLVIVASNKGAVIPRINPRPDAFGDDTRNTFVIMHNPKFYRQSFAKPAADAMPYVGYAAQFKVADTKTSTATLSNPAVGNFGSSGEYTLMYKMRDDAGRQLSWPTFISKRDNRYALNLTGWSYLFDQTGFQLDWFRDGGGGGRPGSGISSRDGVWHSVGFVIRNENGARMLWMFMDGVKGASLNITGKNLDNNFPLAIGSDMASAGYLLSNFMIKDLAILNVGFSDADMVKYMRKEITPASPFFGNLLGWWAFNDIQNGKIADLSGKGNPFTANANVIMASFEDLSPNISPEITDATYRAVVNNIDIPVQIYQWMGISAISSWNLDGKPWRIQYTTVRN
jgi:hypothetical protein